MRNLLLVLACVALPCSPVRGQVRIATTHGTTEDQLGFSVARLVSVTRGTRLIGCGERPCGGVEA